MNPFGARGRGVLLAAWIVGAAAAGAQDAVRVDRSNGSFAGIVWLTASVPEADPAERFAAVGIARLAAAPLERSFALRAGSDAPVLGSAGESPADLVAPGRNVVEVRIGPRAFDEIRHLIARWEGGEQADLPPEVRIENLLERVVRGIGLDAPYRSVLSGSEPSAYVRDLARIN